MIYPRLNRVRSGQQLSVELINGLIKRTEYAADLLRQYKLIAGNGMYIEPHYDGTRVSYLQLVKYRLSGTSFLNSQISVLSFNGSAFQRFLASDPTTEQIGYDIEKEKICGYFLNPAISPLRFDPFLLNINTGIFDYSRPEPFKPLPTQDYYDCFFEGVSNNIVVGTYEDWFYGNCGIIYRNGDLLKTQYPNNPGQEPLTYLQSNETQFKGIYKNKIVGLVGAPASYKGLIFDISSNTYEIINPPPGYFRIYFNGIYEQTICGIADSFSQKDGILYKDGEFTIFPNFPIWKINSKYITSSNGENFLYNYITNETIIIQDPQNPEDFIEIYGLDKDY